jgi:hypothetical protein
MTIVRISNQIVSGRTDPTHLRIYADIAIMPTLFALPPLWLAWWPRWLFLLTPAYLVRVAFGRLGGRRWRRAHRPSDP